MRKQYASLVFIKITLTGALCISSACQAATTTTNFQVTATITASCSVSATTLAFGNYNPVSALAVTAQNTIGITCSNGAPWTADLSTGGAGTYTPRRMSNGGSGTLNYNIYTTAALTTIWGNNTGGTGRASGIGTGVVQNQTGFGQIPAGQNTPPTGAYADNITVTVTF